MKKKLLLSLALVLTGLTSQAQVLMTEDFSAEQTKSSTDVGYYEFINTQDGDERSLENGALHFYNTSDVIGQNWERAVKFRNLPIQENTSYRVTFKLMGSNTYYDVENDAEVRTNARFALMQGGENLDMGFLASDGTQQFSDISRFQTPDEGKGYYTYTGMFYYTTDAAHKAWYKQQNPSKDELPATYFLTINVYNPGDFFIDDVIVEQSTIKGIVFRDDVIRVDFGYAIDAAALLNGQQRLLMPENCVTVKLNGEVINVMTVELLSDGNFYIFLDDQYPSSGDDKIEVSFTNPADPAYRLQYASGKTPGGAVLDFTDEVGVWDDNVDDVYSYKFVTPTMVSADPEDGSFNLPLDKGEFHFTFDKEVDCSMVEAYLESERLGVQPNSGFATDLTFTRSGSLSPGEYTLRVTKIYPEAMLAEDVFGEEKLTLSFGPVNTDPNDTVRVVMTDGFEESGSNTVPPGWVVDSDGTPRTNGSTYGSGCRVITGLQGDISAGMYICSRNNSEGGYATYGTLDEKLSLSEGKYQLTFQCARWDADASYCHVYVLTEDEEVVTEDFRAVEPRSNGSTSNAGATKFELNFRVEQPGNFVLKFLPRNSNDQPGSWADGIVIGNIVLKYLPAAAGVEETNMLNTALNEAKTTLSTYATDRYAGEDYNALQNMVNEYDGKQTVFTAPSQFREAAAALNEATAAMKDHAGLCDTYDPLVDNAKAARDMRTGTKFERHESYAAIEAAITKYEGRMLTDNSQLREAIDELQVTTATVTNIGRVVETYLASMTTGIATLGKLGAANETLAAEVNDLLTDDAAVKAKVQQAVKLAIYGRLADPNNDVFAVKLDEETLEQYVDSFDVSVFINNPEIYYTGWDDKAPAGTAQAMPATENVPGWTITPGDGWSSGINFHYPWGASTQYVYNEQTCPAANGMIASWTFSYLIEQTIEDLPAGTYRLYAGVGERGGNELPTSYIFANDQQQVVPVIAGSVEPTDNVAINDIVVTDGRLRIGFNMAQEDHSFFNDMHLYLVAPATDFDYPKAYAEGINDVSRSVDVRRTELFDLNGRRIGDGARGVIIVKKTMTDGTVKAEKMVK